MMNAEEARNYSINRSKEYNEIVNMDDTDCPIEEVADLLFVECDGQAETEDGRGRPVREYWGADLDGATWRVHLHG